MSKVKRLRKKYRTLCVNAKKASENQAVTLNSDNQPTQRSHNSTNADIKSKKEEQRNRVNAVYDMIIDTKGTPSSDLELRSNYSISKSIKSHFSGQNILKKDKQRLKRELFLKKLESSAELMKQQKQSKRRKKKIDLNDDLPQLLISEEKMSKPFNSIHKNSRIIKKHLSQGKGLTKRRNEQMLKDIEKFQNLLKKDTASENKFEEIQRRILDKLSKEAIESMN